MPPRWNPLLCLDLIERDGEQQVVDIVAAQMRVAVGAMHFEDAFVQLEDRDIEGAAAQIVDRDDAFFLAIESVGQRRGRRLVDQAQHFESSHAAGVFGGLALRIVEVGGNGDDRLRDRSAEKSLGISLELAQDIGGDLRRRELLPAEVDAQHLARLNRPAKTERKSFSSSATSSTPRPIRRLTE